MPQNPARPYSQSPGTHRGTGPQHQSRPGSGQPRQEISCNDFPWLKKISFQDPLDPQLFSDTAKAVAKAIAENASRKNRPSQLRRFYDEIVLWEDKVRAAPEKFAEYRPFLLMMNAKAAYAKGRDVVTQEFVCLVEHTLAQVQNEKTLHLCKVFWEAFMGFYKLERPTD